MKKLLALITIMSGLNCFAAVGFGGFSNTTNLGFFTWLKCSTNLTCTAQGNKLQITSNQTVGSNMSLTGVLNVSGAATFATAVNLNSGVTGCTKTRFTNTEAYGYLDTLHQNSATVYLTQLQIPCNAIITGVGAYIASATSGTSYIVSLFDKSGNALAHSNLSGTNDSATVNGWLKMNFTTPYSAIGPATYYVGIYGNNGTDQIQVGSSTTQGIGTTGTNTGQVYGTIKNVTPPTTYTTDTGPVIFTY